MEAILITKFANTSNHLPANYAKKKNEVGKKKGSRGFTSITPMSRRNQTCVEFPPVKKASRSLKRPRVVTFKSFCRASIQDISRKFLSGYSSSPTPGKVPMVLRCHWRGRQKQLLHNQWWQSSKPAHNVRRIRQTAIAVKLKLDGQETFLLWREKEHIFSTKNKHTTTTQKN